MVRDADALVQWAGSHVLGHDAVAPVEGAGPVAREDDIEDFYPWRFLREEPRRDVRKLWAAMRRADWALSEEEWRACPAVERVVSGSAAEVGREVGSEEVRAAVEKWAGRWERGLVRRAVKWFPGCGWTEEEEVAEAVWLSQYDWQHDGAEGTPKPLIALM